MPSRGQVVRIVAAPGHPHHGRLAVVESRYRAATSPSPGAPPALRPKLSAQYRYEVYVPGSVPEGGSLVSVAGDEIIRHGLILPVMYRTTAAGRHRLMRFIIGTKAHAEGVRELLVFVGDCSELQEHRRRALWHVVNGRGEA